MTNKHESDSSSIESDSGAGPPQGPHIINQNGLIIHPPAYPPPHIAQHQQHPQHRYSHGPPPHRQWTAMPPPPGGIRLPGNPPVQLLTMAMTGGAKGYDSRQPPPPGPPVTGNGIISAGPTMTQGPVTPGVSTNSPTSNGTATSGTPSAGGPPTGSQLPIHDVFVHVQKGEVISLFGNGNEVKYVQGTSSPLIQFSQLTNCYVL